MPRIFCDRSPTNFMRKKSISLLILDFLFLLKKHFVCLILLTFQKKLTSDDSSARLFDYEPPNPEIVGLVSNGTSKLHTTSEKFKFFVPIAKKNPFL